MKEENLEKLGVLADTIENLMVGLSMTSLPDSIHVEGLRGSLPDIKKELDEIYQDEFLKMTD